MTSTNIPTLNISSPYTLLSSLQPQTSQPDIKTPTLATPIGQSMFSFDDQKTGGLSPNFLSLNGFGNLSSSSLLAGLTVTSPISSGGGTTVQLNNYNNNNPNNNNLINVSNLITNTQTPTTMNRPLVPDGQSGLLPNVTHTPLIMDAMKAYNTLFPQQVSTSQQVPTTATLGGNLNNRNTTTGNGGTNTVNSGVVGGMSPLTESFSDFKIEPGQGQNNSHAIPTSMVGLSSQQVMPLDILSTSDTLFELSRERSMPEGLAIPDGLFRGESVVSTVSQGNAHFVPSFYPMEEPQVSDGGLGPSPQSTRGPGPTLQFAMQMGQQMPMNNVHTNGNGGNNLMNGMPAVPGFPPMTMMNGYDVNGMPTLDNNGMIKTYGQEYWQQMPFQIPMSQSQYPSVDLNMSNNGMGMGMPTMDPSNLYSMGSYGTTMTTTDNGMPSQLSGNEYNPDLEGQSTQMMGGRRRPKHSGASRGNNNGGDRNSGTGDRGNNSNGRRRGRNMPPTNTNMHESEEVTSSSGNTRGGSGGARNNEMTNFERDNISLMDLVKNELIEKCARDQHGSRFIQRALETATLTEKTAVFKQIEKCALGLCEDVFGNYVIQKFFEHGTDNHKITLAKILIGRVLPLTKSMYGCRVIQKALESVEKNMRIALVSELDGHVEECVRDQNGNHVIQKAIEEVPPEHLDFIVKTFDGKVYDFSTHPYGCRVIQRLLERCTPKQKESLLKEILKQVSTLSKDQYGNYVVQHMLQHGTPEAREAIIQIVATNIVAMSRQKFSSNVVEKLFANASEEEKDYLIENIMGFHSEAPPLVQMVRDQYGNYVIQKILEVANQQQRNRLINRIFELVPNLRKLMFGKHIINKIESITGNQYK